MGGAGSAEDPLRPSLLTLRQNTSIYNPSREDIDRFHISAHTTHVGGFNGSCPTSGGLANYRNAVAYSAGGRTWSDVRTNFIHETGHSLNLGHFLNDGARNASPAQNGCRHASIMNYEYNVGIPTTVAPVPPCGTGTVFSFARGTSFTDPTGVNGCHVGAPYYKKKTCQDQSAVEGRRCTVQSDCPYGFLCVGSIDKVCRCDCDLNEWRQRSDWPGSWTIEMLLPPNLDSGIAPIITEMATSDWY